MTGIDVSHLGSDEPIFASQSKEATKVTSHLDSFEKGRKQGNVLTPMTLGDGLSAGGISPLTVGSPSTVADELERWMEVADLDGFNISHIVTPGSWEDVVDLLISELRKRGLYPEEIEEGLTARERAYGKGQNRLLPGHTGTAYKFEVYEEQPHVEAANR